MSRRICPAAAVLLAVVGVAAVGCHGTGKEKTSIDDRYAKYVDPCWPERYNHIARQEVLAPFAIQVNNATILEQTLSNHHFDVETDTLNQSGILRLDYMIHRRPSPETRIYVQTARDIKYDPTKPDQYITKRQELDAKRAQAILRYVNTQTAARPMNFDVQVLDAGEPTIRAEIIAGASRGLPALYRSGISGGAGGVAGAGGGSVGGGGGPAMGVQP